MRRERKIAVKEEKKDDDDEDTSDEADSTKSYIAVPNKGDNKRGRKRE